MKRTVWTIVAVVVGLVLLICIGVPLAEWPFILLFGWILFLVRTLPQVTVEPAALVVAGMALLLSLGLVHYLARWLYRRRAADPAAAPPAWRFRWTLATVAIVVFAFVAGIAIVGVVHQGVWLLVSRQPWYESGMRETVRRMQSKNNLRQIGEASESYDEVHQTFPPGGTFNEYGEQLHSWETMLLPYLDEQELPDWELPWSHPQNAVYFKRRSPYFQNPGVRLNYHGTESSDVDSEGYGLSHYSANVRVMGANSSVRAEEVTDGRSYTIAVGEVKENFKPWGHPVNWRDPADGVQTSPDGFGGPWRSGATQFLMLDGAVQSVAPDIDPQVLRALATPAGGERLPDGW